MVRTRGVIVAGVGHRRGQHLDLAGATEEPPDPAEVGVRPAVGPTVQVVEVPDRRVRRLGVLACSWEEHADLPVDLDQARRTIGGRDVGAAAHLEAAFRPGGGFGFLPPGSTRSPPQNDDPAM